MDYMHPKAAPFSYAGDERFPDTVCLLIHGFAGSPAQILELGEILNGQGFNVEGILLAGHSTSPDEMTKTGWKDWQLSAEEKYLECAEKYSKINLVGLSMGGLVAINIAAKYPVYKLVLMSAPVRFRKRLIKLTPLAQFFMKSHKVVKSNRDKEGYNTELDIAYDEIPISRIPHVLKMSKVANKNLSRIDVPVLVFQSARDRQVALSSSRIIDKKVRTADKTFVWLEESRHLVTLDKERYDMSDKILDFFKSDI